MGGFLPGVALFSLPLELDFGVPRDLRTYKGGGGGRGDVIHMQDKPTPALKRQLLVCFILCLPRPLLTFPGVAAPFSSCSGDVTFS